MSTPRILGLGRAVPQRRYAQRDLEALNPWETTPLVERLLFDSPVASRGLFVPPDWYTTPRSLSDTNRAWREGAMLLGSHALRELSQSTDTPLSSIDFLGVTSVTGYTTPGLDLLLAQQEGLPATISRAHFNCIGCHAAVPLLKVASDHVSQRPDELAVALAVEICSACFALDESAQNLVALSLFGDGAAAALVGTEGAGPRIVDFASVFDYAHMDALGFSLTASGFRIVLDPSIPRLIAESIGSAVDDLLERNGLSRADISTWCVHPGGSRVLDEVQGVLSLTDADLQASRRVLRSYGNMSSPSVLFVLAESLAHREPPQGSYGVLAAFGPGLGIELALIAFDDGM